MIKKLSYFKGSESWINDSSESPAWIEAMKKEPSVGMGSISNMLDSESYIAMQNSISHRTKIKAFLYRGHTVLSLIKGNKLEILTPGGVAPDNLVKISFTMKNMLKDMSKNEINSGLSGTFISQSIDSHLDNDTSRSMVVKGYFGKGMYMSQTPSLNIKEDFKSRYDQKSERVIAFYRIKPSANIITPEDPQFSQVKRNMNKDFFNHFIKSTGVDGVFDKENGVIAIFNEKAIKYVSSSPESRVEREIKNIALSNYLQS